MYTFYPLWPRQALTEESRWIFLPNTPVTTHCPALGFAGWSCWILAVKSSQLLMMTGNGHGHPWENKSVTLRLRKFLLCILWDATWVRLCSHRLCWFLGSWQGLYEQIPAHLQWLHIQTDCKVVQLPLAVAELMQNAGLFGIVSVLLESLLIASLLSSEHQEWKENLAFLSYCFPSEKCVYSFSVSHFFLFTNKWRESLSALDGIVVLFGIPHKYLLFGSGLTGHFISYSPNRLHVSLCVRVERL